MVFENFLIICSVFHISTSWMARPCTTTGHPAVVKMLKKKNRLETAGVTDGSRHLCIRFQRVCCSKAIILLNVSRAFIALAARQFIVNDVRILYIYIYIPAEFNRTTSVRSPQTRSGVGRITGESHGARGVIFSKISLFRTREIITITVRHYGCRYARTRWN